MADPADLSTVVLAGVVSLRARLRATPRERRETETDQAITDLLALSYRGMPGEAVGDTGDEPALIDSFLHHFEETVRV